ncbi:type II toxin-antitoxin system RelE family toxin [Nostoc sp.]|uniref:type II toxin-antitoxin system RelE family toxin n=1 Tax=Nostoc sp. TaxID=1180 RepID=UPI002FF996EC
MSYQVTLVPSAVQKITELDSEVQQRLAQKLEELALIKSTFRRCSSIEGHRRAV